MSDLGKRLIASLKDAADNPSGVKKHKILYTYPHIYLYTHTLSLIETATYVDLTIVLTYFVVLNVSIWEEIHFFHIFFKKKLFHQRKPKKYDSTC